VHPNTLIKITATPLFLTFYENKHAFWEYFGHNNDPFWCNFFNQDAYLNRDSSK
jgi:hypothetical protein